MNEEELAKIAFEAYFGKLKEHNYVVKIPDFECMSKPETEAWIEVAKAIKNTYTKDS